MSKLTQDQHVYAVTLVHTREKGLLNRQDIEQLIAAPSVPEAFRLLSDKGWGAPDMPENDPDALVAIELEKTWNLMGELGIDLNAFNVFRFANDYHNLKAAIKLAYSGEDDVEAGGQYFLKYGTVEIDKIVKAANDHDFSALSPEMAEAGRLAYEALAHTSSGQACDMIIDRAALIAIDTAGKKADSDLLKNYARLTVDSANIKAAVRCVRMEKDREFIERAIAPAGTLDTAALLNAAVSGMEAVYSFLDKTLYSGAVDALKSAMAVFERWCDNQLIEMIRPQRNNYFTIEPLAAFILGRENEIRMVRLVLSAKINHLHDDVFRERLRDMYV